MPPETDNLTNPPTDAPTPPPEKQRSLLLMVAAAAVIAVPALLGYMLLRGDSSPSSTPIGVATTGGMGGGMAGGPSTTAGAIAAVDLPEGVLAFSTIQANDITIEPDPTGTSATLRVNTTIDVACAAVYGPTPAFGMLATDSDMAGGGHAVHQPVMRGLAPETTYYYILEGVGPDGALYRSDVMQFTTPAGSGTPQVQAPGPNIAPLARVAAVSSQYSDAYAGVLAIDGDLSTEWSSAGDGDDAYIVLEFDENMLFSGVGFRTRSMTDGTSITTSFTVTDENGRTYGPFDAGPGLAIARVEFFGTTVRIDVDTSTGGNTGAVEIEVYGEPEM